jgi:hypothetical protein
MAKDNSPSQGGLLDLLGPAPFDESGQNYEAVGRLITAYANAEGALHQLARHLTGLSDDKARVLFAGMRVGDITDRIRALVRLNKTPNETAANIEACLVQLAEIASRRHSLVHRGSIFVFGTLFVSNVSTAKTTEGIEEEHFSYADLTNMALDCYQIYLRIMRVIHPFNPAFVPLPHQPWRYKPAQPKAQNQSRRKDRGSQSPPPGTSRG